MWMVLVSLMEDQDSISGHLLQQLMKSALVLTAIVPALTLILQAKQLHLQHSLGVTTSVILAVVQAGRTYSMETTLCGMVLVVGLGTHAAPSTILHGSTSSWSTPPLMTLR
jgi:hypothetical protein